MVAKSEEDGPILKYKYAFYTEESDSTDASFIGYFESDQHALKYAEAEGFDSFRRILLIMDYPLTEEQGVQIANNLNKFQAETNNLMKDLNESFTPQQLETFYKLLCYTFHKV